MSRGILGWIKRLMMSTNGCTFGLGTSAELSGIVKCLLKRSATFGHWAMMFQRSCSSHAVRIDVFDLTKSLQFSWPQKAGSRTVQPVRSFLRVFNSSIHLKPLQP